MIENIKEYIEEVSKLLPLNSSISYTDAERRASKFLGAQAMLASWKHELTNGKIAAATVQTAIFAAKMAEGTAKTMTENKLVAEASAEYTNAREDLERVENDISYLKAYMDIFSAAHVFYRQMARGDNNG